MIYDVRSRTKTLLTIVIASLITLMGGCSEEDPQLAFRELGNPADVNAIEQALSKALDGANIHVAKPGQFAHYESNYRADLEPVVKMSDEMRELVEIKDTPELRTYVLNEAYREYDRHGTVVDEKFSEVALEYYKVNYTTNSLMAHAAEVQASLLASATDEDCGKEKEDNGKVYDCIRYYNFQSFQRLEEVPELAKTRPNCANVKGCVLPAHVLQFDRVKFHKGEIVDREVVKMAISKSIPALFPDLGLPPVHYYCLGKIYNFSDLAVYINQCTVLRDLQL